MNDQANRMIEKLGLQPHPEGGWFRETWRAPSRAGDRSASTAILFLLKAGEKSHWHRIDADEIWLHHAGDPMSVSIASSDRDTPVANTIGDPAAGFDAQAIVPRGFGRQPSPQLSMPDLALCLVSLRLDLISQDSSWHPPDGHQVCCPLIDGA